MTSAADIKRYREFLAEEVDGLYIYHQLAEIEQDERLADVYRQLAVTEERHLELWRTQLREAGIDDTPGAPSRRTRLLMWLARRFGPDLVLPVIKTFEANATDMYIGDPIAEAAHLPQDEAAHARVFDAIASSGTSSPGSAIGRVEARHRALGGGNALRASVLGANDGLVSNLALVMGFAGAAPGQATVVLAGVAGLVAGAFSMALGEWVSVTSSREAAEAQLAVEAEELALMPEAEAEELALIYQAKGLPKEDAERLAAHIVADEETALDTLAREELGIVPDDLGSPWTAALASFILFSLGAMIPVVPFLFGDGARAIIASAGLSGVALFALGGGITLLTGRSVWYSGGRQVLLGLAAAAVTFGIGSVIGEIAGI